MAQVGELAAKKAAGQDRLRTHPLSLSGTDPYAQRRKVTYD